MRLLDRYLLRELLVPLAYCLFGFLIAWVAFDLLNELNELQGHRLRAREVVEYYAVKTPELLVTVMPVALLLALLYALTSHARHQELTAIRAAGVGLWRICVPYLVVGFTFSVGLFALNELWVPDSAEWADEILNRHTRPGTNALGRAWQRQLSFRNDRDNRRWDIGAYNVETGEMLRPHVEWRTPDGTGREIFAERAARTDGVWVFSQVQEFTTAPLPGAIPVPSQTNELRLAELWETPELIKSEIKINNLSLRSAAKKAQLSLEEILLYERLHPHLPGPRRAILATQFHARLALPWTCLVVALIAIPFGAPSGRRNVFVGVASSIFICFTFFVLQQAGLALGTGGYLPPWVAAWGPNLLFGLTGVWLTARVR
ncbi:MAG: LptF/LptG family permease [Verrucomicrobia bacterium]|nr:LptF/LptG family permease [Verrucomicrobiota bacterium]